MMLSLDNIPEFVGWGYTSKNEKDEYYIIWDQDWWGFGEIRVQKKRRYWFDKVVWKDSAHYSLTAEKSFLKAIDVCNKLNKESK